MPVFELVAPVFEIACLETFSVKLRHWHGVSQGEGETVEFRHPLELPLHLHPNLGELWTNVATGGLCPAVAACFVTLRFLLDGIP